MARDRRQKATDVFAEARLWLGEKTNDFDRAFPHIADVRIEITQDGEGVRGWNRHEVLGKRSAGEYYNCANPLCYNGGFCLGEILRFMEEQRQTERELDLRCQGYEGTPKGRKKYGPCFNRFHVKIQVAYKAESN
ncbi:MAG: hypothetical protein Q8P31_04925 [Bacillota bacterium]|nr:hypothetical protein [Bacillota bacterium]